MRTVADLRAMCGQLPCTIETFPFYPHVLVFKVGSAEKGKMYALTDIQEDPIQVSLKVKPEYGEQLRAKYPSITPAYHMNKRHWITVVLDGSVPDELSHELIKESYALVVKGMTKAQRVEWNL